MYNYYNYNELEEIRHEQKAMEEAIPPSEWGKYDDIQASLARQKLKIMFGGDEN